MHSRSLIDVLGEELARKDLQLPVYPGIATRVQALAASGTATAEQFEMLLSHDPAIASQVLRVANSAFYAGLSSVATIRAAVMRLGLDATGHAGRRLRPEGTVHGPGSARAAADVAAVAALGGRRVRVALAGRTVGLPRPRRANASWPGSSTTSASC